MQLSTRQIGDVSVIDVTGKDPGARVRVDSRCDRTAARLRPFPHRPQSGRAGIHGQFRARRPRLVQHPGVAVRPTAEGGGADAPPEGTAPRHAARLDVRHLRDAGRGARELSATSYAMPIPPAAKGRRHECARRHRQSCASWRRRRRRPRARSGWRGGRCGATRAPGWLASWPPSVSSRHSTPPATAGRRCAAIPTARSSSAAISTRSRTAAGSMARSA